mgnify:CR=1 FL=1
MCTYVQCGYVLFIVSEPKINISLWVPQISKWQVDYLQNSQIRKNL